MGEYISFCFVSDEDVDLDVFSEKLCDYFEKLEIKTKKKFEDLLQTYLGAWDNLVSKRIAKTPSSKKNEPPAPVPRARRYYEKIQELRKSRELTLRQIVDYSRVSLCLYSSIIEADWHEITDFEYSSKCLNIDKVIASMKKEKASVIVMAKKTLFDLTELYCDDTGIFIITMIIYFYIKNNELVGE